MSITDVYLYFLFVCTYIQDSSKNIQISAFHIFKVDHCSVLNMIANHFEDPWIVFCWLHISLSCWLELFCIFRLHMVLNLSVKSTDWRLTFRIVFYSFRGIAYVSKRIQSALKIWSILFLTSFVTMSYVSYWWLFFFFGIKLGIRC